jgi:ribosomal protein S12 methylthiotransferase RimO
MTTPVQDKSSDHTPETPAGLKKVALITMGCSRNEVDSEELAGRLAADGWELVSQAEEADIAVINTCGFIESAKQDSIEALLGAHSLKSKDGLQAVVAVGCMAQRYGSELKDALPEADGILGFDDYSEISSRLQKILSGHEVQAPTQGDRRKLLPIAPSDRAQLKATSNATFARARLDSHPFAPLKIATGCDRRCAFCAIPSFRGSFVSRLPDEIVEEANWLVQSGVSELFLVSENSTSFGKDLGDLSAMEKLLPRLAAIEGVERIRLSYLQPAEIRPALLQAMISTPKVSPYFDLSFQHASGTVLRRMRRFGDGEKFLHLLEQIRVLSPDAGVRSNFIVGFPGETEAEFEELVDFVSRANLDAIGVFGYSDEDGTEAENHENKLDSELINHRVEILSRLVDSKVSERAAARIGSEVLVLIEDSELGEGRVDTQGPEVDGTTTFMGYRAGSYRVGQYVRAKIVDSDGADLIAMAL